MGTSVRDCVYNQRDMLNKRNKTLTQGRKRSHDEDWYGWFVSSTGSG